VRTAQTRRPLAVVATVATTAGLVAALLWWAPWQPAGDPGPAPGGGQIGRSDPDAALRARLGGLSGLLIGDDPLLRACADPAGATPGPDPSGGSPGPDPEATTPGPDPTPEPDQADPVATVIAQTEALRGRRLPGPPEIQLLAGEQMTDRVAEFFADRGDPEQVDIDRRALTALGAIVPGTDLAALRVDAFAEQVSGYHLGAEAQIGVRVQTPGALSPLERVVLAHELEHALSYQHLGRPADYREGEETADARRAASALVEGSAAAAMLQYATTVLDPVEQAAMRVELVDRAGQDALSGYSPYLRAELRFPYLAGLRYTCQRFLDGGWPAVEAGYRDPPASTAAVLFPERQGEQPREPAALAEPGRPWRHADTSSFGLAELEWLLAAPGGDPGAGLDRLRERVADWDGGLRTVWTDGAATAVGLALVDRGERGPPLCDTVREWYAAAFPTAAANRGDTSVRFDGQRQDAVLTCPGSQVRLGIAPTLDEASAITR
jgi:hypothetical protein